MVGFISLNRFSKTAQVLILPVLLFILMHANAQDVVIKRSSVIEQYKGKPYYLHFVEQGQTINSICQAYNVTKEELLLENPILQDGLKADQVIRIPKKDDPKIPVNQNASGKTLSQDQNVKPLPESKPQKGNAPTPAVEKSASGGKRYLVKKQETLYGISKQFNISIEELQNANPGMVTLQEGMEIIIPEPSKPVSPEKSAEKKSQPDKPSGQINSYKEIAVQQGQTVYSLSKQYGISVEKFLELNPEANQGLRVDQVIKVPAQANTKNDTPVQVNKAVEKKVEPPVISTAVNPKRESSSPAKSISDSCKGINHTDKTFEIALLLPLDLENADTILNLDETSTSTASDFKAFDFFQFYSGILMAADSLEKIGFKANIHVYDADKESDTLKIKKALRKNSLSGMDLVIGPVFAKSFDVASRYALKENVSIVNPLSRREKILNGNPRIIMAQTSEEAMAAYLARHIAANYKGANVIVCRKGAKEMASFAGVFLKELHRVDSLSGLHIQEVNYETESFAGCANKLWAEGNNVVLLLSANRSLVPNFVSLLNNANKNKNITLFGLPGWDEMGMEIEFLEKLDYHQLTPTYIDYSSEAVDQFVKNFRSEYGTEPLADKFAFLGYDIGWYFFQALMKYGHDFGPCLDNLDIRGLQTNFYYSGWNKTNGLQNASCRIVRLNDFNWVEVR